MLRSGLRTEQVCIGDKVDVMPDISSAQGQLLQANNPAVKTRQIWGIGVSDLRAKI